MKPKLHILATLSLLLSPLLLLLPEAAIAQPPPLLNYQGRVSVGGTNFHGTGNFKFVLVNEAGDTTYWSHDDTSFAASEPTTSVAVDVVNGLYSVLLTDFDENMPSLAQSFANDDVYLRVWFNDGASGFEQLAPDQRLTSVGYAFSAGTAATIEDGAVTAAKVDAGTFNQTFWRADGNEGTTPGTHFIGTTDDEAFEIRVNGQRALRIEPDPFAPRIIGGDPANTASNIGSVVVGGRNNHATRFYSFVGGGRDNQATGDQATVVGGQDNLAMADHSFVGGGGGNEARGFYSTIVGGDRNVSLSGGAIAGGTRNVAHGSSFIGGGLTNRAEGLFSAIPGGWGNQALGETSFAAGRRAIATHNGSFVWADNINAEFESAALREFAVRAGGGMRVVAPSISLVGGNFVGSGSGLTDIGASSLDVGDFNQTFWRADGNAGTTPGTHFIGTTDNQEFHIRVNNQTVFRITPDGALGPRIVGGHLSQGTQAGVTVSGGRNNSATGQYAVVSGGRDNVAGGLLSTVGGGSGNIAMGNSVVGGGLGNYAQSTSVVSGGRSNATLNLYSTVGGGEFNRTESGAIWATVGGGRSNIATTNHTTVAGGRENEASGLSATVGGGQLNKATNEYATVAGGHRNEAHGVASMVAGGRDNRAVGIFSFAAGRRAIANHAGSFVWGDNTNSDVVSALNNSWTSRASAGYRLFSNGNMTLGAQLIANATTWSAISDREAKENFEEIDAVEILEKLTAIPVTAWTYKADPNGRRYIGPVAQDFHDAFGLGDDLTINTLDADGVAFAAIQGLHQIVQERDAEIEALREANQRMANELEAIKRHLGM